MSTAATIPLHPATAYGPHPYIADDLGACLGCGHPEAALCHPEDPWGLGQPSERTRSAAAAR